MPAVGRVAGGAKPRMPNDFLSDEDRAAKASFSDLWLDIGASNREEALALVAIGDPVTFAPRFAELAGGLVTSQALDDRTGVYAIVRALEECAARVDGSAARFTAVATVGEETGFVGARRVALTQRPDVIVVVDVT
ncbi:MAG TPA: M42 family peptidase, partial [Thermoleophilia bacterium]